MRRSVLSNVTRKNAALLALVGTMLLTILVSADLLCQSPDFGLPAGLAAGFFITAGFGFQKSSDASATSLGGLLNSGK